MNNQPISAGAEVLAALKELRSTIELQLSPQHINTLARLFSPNAFNQSPEGEHQRVLREGVCRISDLLFTNLSGATDMYVHIWNNYRIPAFVGESIVIHVPAGTSKGVHELGGITFDKGVAVYASTSATALVAHTQLAKFYASWQV